jgi:dihydrodipicolinate synthase/N-acetylneuraminate lyase
MSLEQAIDQLVGVWNIVPTPFADDEELDLPSLRTLTDFVVGSGVDGMTILGVLGEGGKLSDRERSAVIDTTLEQACASRSAQHPGTARWSTHAKRRPRERTR